MDASLWEAFTHAFTRIRRDSSHFNPSCDSVVHRDEEVEWHVFIDPSEKLKTAAISALLLPLNYCIAVSQLILQTHARLLILKVDLSP